MPLDDKQRKQIEAALANKQTATRGDLLLRYTMDVTLTPDYVGYFNPRLTVAVDQTTSFEVTHLKFTPVPEAGYVAIEACTADEAGAQVFDRGDSGRTGTVPLRAALQAFNLLFPADRKLKLPVEINDVTVDGKEQAMLMMLVKRPARQKKEVRTRKDGKSAAKPAQGTGPAEGVSPDQTAATLQAPKSAKATKATKQPEIAPDTGAESSAGSENLT